MGKHGEDEGKREKCINLPGCGMIKGQCGGDWTGAQNGLNGLTLLQDKPLAWSS